MKFNPGRLKDKVKILERVEKVNELGQTVQEFKTVRNPYAEVIDVRGNKYYDAKKIEPEITHFVYVRFSKKPVEQDMVIEHRGKRYEVKSCIDIKNEHIQFEIQCIEKVRKSDKNE